MPAVNEEITKAPPRERTVIEGNIVEHPIWRVSNPQDRPKRLMVDKETGKVLVDPGTMKPREYVDPEDYTQVIDLVPAPSDPRKRRQLVITADLHARFPTVHARSSSWRLEAFLSARAREGSDRP